MSRGNVLVVDDEYEIGALVQEILEDEGYHVITANNTQQARGCCQEMQPDVVLLDIWMPDEDGISLLKEWLQINPHFCPVIMMSGHGTIETAVEATRLGAYDFLEKPLSMAKLLLTVERALEEYKLHSNLHQQTEPLTVIEPIGKSPVMERLREQARKLAIHETRILFTGEAGTGKEVFARYLHHHSVRRNSPFVRAVIGAIDPDQAIIEFIGWQDADDISPGFFEQANGGTLFLDGISNLDIDTQLRLFRILQSNTLIRVGGTAPIKIDVRVLSSARVDLQQKVASGQFRADLYYLINEVALTIPPLREYPDDISDLLSYYVDYFVSREKLTIRRFSVAAQNFLRHHSWGGNVQELKNLVHQVLILGAGDEIELDEVKAAIQNRNNEQIVDSVPDLYNLPLKDAREHFERNYLQHHLKQVNGSVSRLSELVGLERTHLYRKLHALDIQFKEKR